MKITSLDVHITDRCNLSCEYCYLHRPDFKGRDDIPDWLISLLPQVIKRLGVKKVNFFGGEPMVAFDRIQAVIENTKALGVRYGIVTNGVVCSKEQAEYLQRHKVGMQRSIDGCPEACAINRPDVAEKYLRLTDIVGDRGKPRRSTITENAVHLLYRSWLWLKDNGFDRGWTPIPDNYAEWSDASLDTWESQLKAIARDLVRDVEIGKHPFYNYWFSRLDAAIRNPKQIRPRGCGAGSSLLALRQDGFFFACHRFVTDDALSDWCWGHVYDLLSGRELKPGPGAARAIRICKQEFQSAPEFEQCRNCEAQAGCAAGCYHTNRAVNGDAVKPTRTWCEMRKRALPIAKWIHSKIGPCQQSHGVRERKDRVMPAKPPSAAESAGHEAAANSGKACAAMVSGKCKCAQ